jgi:DNA (cytosine-5)-methyltransferase 1
MRGSSGDLAMPSVAVQYARYELLDTTARKVRFERWGRYTKAIRGWEVTLGRPAPEPTQISPRTRRPQLAPAFVEWMMGLPAGWVCGVPGLSRNKMLSLLGDGVVPQQMLAGYSELMHRTLGSTAE